MQPQQLTGIPILLMRKTDLPTWVQRFGTKSSALVQNNANVVIFWAICRSHLLRLLEKGKGIFPENIRRMRQQASLQQSQFSGVKRNKCLGSRIMANENSWRREAYGQTVRLIIFGESTFQRLRKFCLYCIFRDTNLLVSARLETFLEVCSPFLYISISVLFHFLCQAPAPPDDAILLHHLILRPLTADATHGLTHSLWINSGLNRSAYTHCGVMRNNIAVWQAQPYTYK